MSEEIKEVWNCLIALKFINLEYYFDREIVSMNNQLAYEMAEKRVWQDYYTNKEKGFKAKVTERLVFKKNKVVDTKPYVEKWVTFVDYPEYEERRDFSWALID